MVITIKDENNRFGARVSGIIYNKDKTKIFMQRQGNHDFYMFPGGRIELHEDSHSAIKRELKEELNIEEDDKLSYIGESFIDFPNLKYHEIGFFYKLTIDENKYEYYDEEYDSLDLTEGKSKYKWIKIEELDKYKINPEIMKEKLKEDNNELVHFIYREY